MGLPLFNRIVSDELTLLGDFEGLTAKLTRYVSLSDTTALRRVVLERVAAEFARPPGRDSLLADVLACLLVVPNGLHESELIAASSCPPVTWSLLRTSLAGTVLIFRGELLTLADADVVTVARQLCDAASLERARTALDQHYADSAEREFERLRSELAQSSERSAHAYVRGARAPPLPHSTTLVRSLRMRAALLANVIKYTKFLLSFSFSMINRCVFILFVCLFRLVASMSYATVYRSRMCLKFFGAIRVQQKAMRRATTCTNIGA